MYEQAQRLPYTSPYGTTSAVTVELARKLAELTPGDLGATFFCNSGSEAVEAAIKLARQYHEANGEARRYKVISLRRAYHGSTVGALSATGWSPGFGVFRRSADPMVPAAGFTNAMPPYCYRCELGLTYPGCDLACGTTIEQAILGSDPELVSCVILEPIMATGGCIVPPPGYLAKVREICDRYGVLLIADEVVCGFGRTGRWFGVDHFGVVPGHHGRRQGPHQRLRADGGRHREARDRRQAPRLLQRPHVRRPSGVGRGGACQHRDHRARAPRRERRDGRELHDRAPRGPPRRIPSSATSGASACSWRSSWSATPPATRASRPRSASTTRSPRSHARWACSCVRSAGRSSWLRR